MTLCCAASSTIAAQSASFCRIVPFTRPRSFCRAGGTCVSSWMWDLNSRTLVKSCSTKSHCCFAHFSVTRRVSFGGSLTAGFCGRTHRGTGAGRGGSGERRGELRRPLSQLDELDGWDAVSSSSDQSSFPSLDAGTLLSLAPLEWEFVSDNAMNSSSSSGIEWRLDELQPFRGPLRRGSMMF